MILFITFAIIIASAFIAMSFLLEEKLDFKSPKLYCYYTIGVVISFLGDNLGFFKILSNAVVFIGIAKFVFNKSLKESIVIGIFSLVACAVAEAIIVLIDQATFKATGNADVNFKLVTNICIGIIYISICRIKMIKTFASAFIEATAKIKESQIVVFLIIVISNFNVFSFLSYYAFNYSVDGYYIVFFGTALTVVCSFIVFNYFKSTTKYINVHEKYSLSLESIREYEEILEKYRINHHENKNQLLTIRNICKNKKAIEYIDSIIKNELTDDDQLLIEASKIPNGGLRGLLYSKLLVIKDKNISFELVVDNKINVSRMSKLDDSLLTDICMIVGVFIDNAIEAIQELEEKYILIEIYREGKSIVVAITNNYAGYIDIDKITASGYSTKGNDRGYGLTLVDKIIDRNSELENLKEIVNDNFIQRLKIQTQKNPNC